MVGNGLCNDESNTAACNFDGGDCCGSCAIAVDCTECLCLGSGDSNNEVPTANGNGVCNDETNNAECDYDGGDCCLSPASVEHCSECTCSISGFIISPGFPQNYDNNLNLNWLIQIPLGKLIEINFLIFDVDYFDVSCSGSGWEDSVTIHDGSSDSYPILGQFCGDSFIPNQIISSSNQVFINFYTDWFGSGNGFKLEYYQHLVLACDSSVSWYIGDGYCDDVTNTEGCHYDGGDCCGPNVDTEYCLFCLCLENSECLAPSELIGNGLCNDETNIAGCSYDGGDCCAECVDTRFCSECLCYEGGTVTSKPVCSNCPSNWIWMIGTGSCIDATNTANCNFDNGDCCGNNIDINFCVDCVCYEDLNCAGPLDLIGNGFCNDETNNAECNFDGGDCCGTCANTEQCNVCQCHENSPINYSCNLFISKIEIFWLF